MNTTSFSWRNWLYSSVDLAPATIDQLIWRFEHVRLPVDGDTLDHNKHAALLACRLAERAGLSPEQMKDFLHGAMLHDLGKLLIPPQILNKPSALTNDEWAVIKRHPDYSYLLLCDIPELAGALDIPSAHHECWDGSGYPRGLKGEEIPLAARIYSIVDCWDALISDRPYRKAFTVERAREIITGMAGTHFDPSLLALFLS